MDEHLGRINVSKHRFYLLNDTKRPEHHATYRAGPTARQSTAVEKNGRIAE